MMNGAAILRVVANLPIDESIVPLPDTLTIGNLLENLMWVTFYNDANRFRMFGESSIACRIYSFSNQSISRFWADRRPSRHQPDRRRLTGLPVGASAGRPTVLSIGPAIAGKVWASVRRSCSSRKDREVALRWTRSRI